MAKRGFRWTVLVAGGLAMLAMTACGKKKDEGATSGGGGGGSGGGGGAPAAVKFVEKELTFANIKVKAMVPDGWKEECMQGMFAKCVYRQDDFAAENLLTISETCGGMCEPAKWLENAKTEAGEFIGFVNNPEMYSPPAKAEVLEQTEVEPGKYVLKLNILPVDASSARKPSAQVIVWRYGPDWPYLAKCEFEANAELLGQLDAFRQACLDVSFVGTVAPAN